MSVYHSPSCNDSTALLVSWWTQVANTMWKKNYHLLWTHLGQHEEGDEYNFAVHSLLSRHHKLTGDSCWQASRAHAFFSLDRSAAIIINSQKFSELPKQKSKGQSSHKRCKVVKHYKCFSCQRSYAVNYTVLLYLWDAKVEKPIACFKVVDELTRSYSQ
jgi:hypothetical protein